MVALAVVKIKQNNSSLVICLPLYILAYFARNNFLMLLAKSEIQGAATIYTILCERPFQSWNSLLVSSVLCNSQCWYKVTNAELDFLWK